MIEILHLDEHGHVVQIDYIPAPPAGNGTPRELTPETVLDDLIFIRPDWPPVGSPDFAERLRRWHAQQQSFQAA